MKDKASVSTEVPECVVFEDTSLPTNKPTSEINVAAAAAQSKIKGIIKNATENHIVSELKNDALTSSSTEFSPAKLNKTPARQKKISSYYTPSPQSGRKPESTEFNAQQPDSPTSLSVEPSLKLLENVPAQEQTTKSSEETPALKSVPAKVPTKTKSRKKGTSRKKTTKENNSERDKKVTEFFPVRRSERNILAKSKQDSKSLMEQQIRDKVENGLKVVDFDDKGRGVVATKPFGRGDFVVEYAGDLISTKEARQREKLYEADDSVGCYVYHFQYGSKSYCVDATAETGRLGRLVNHSKSHNNCTTRLCPVDGLPRLVLIANRDIRPGDEILYDYGDRSKAAIVSHPWLSS